MVTITARPKAKKRKRVCDAATYRAARRNAMKLRRRSAP